MKHKALVNVVGLTLTGGKFYFLLKIFKIPEKLMLKLNSIFDWSFHMNYGEEAKVKTK